MADHEISLKWNGYQSNILANVKELFQDEGLSDVTLVSEGRSFKAHKVILSANSSVFKNIFQQNPHKDPIIVLHDINTQSLKTLLTFMYNGEVNVTEEFLPMLLKTADSLRICGLSTGSEPKIDEDNKKQKALQAPSSPQPRKRKKCISEGNNNKKEKLQDKPDNLSCANNIVPKLEPIESTLPDLSGESTNDTDIALLDDKKYNASPDNYSYKNLSEKPMRKCMNEVTSTQPCLNLDKGINGFDRNGMNGLDRNINGMDKAINLDKSNQSPGNPDAPVDDKDCIEIDKEIENVLQSGTIVESLNIATENLNSVSSESQKDKSGAYYASPSFPCPFCPRVYNSWGYRRRHVKSRHTNNRLSCKWCVNTLSSTGAWYSHATRAHGVPHEEARNSLVVMVEAHAVLTLNEPSVASLLHQVDMSEGNEKKVEDK